MVCRLCMHLRSEVDINIHSCVDFQSASSRILVKVDNLFCRTRCMMHRTKNTTRRNTCMANGVWGYACDLKEIFNGLLSCKSSASAYFIWFIQLPLCWWMVVSGDIIIIIFIKFTYALFGMEWNWIGLDWIGQIMVNIVRFGLLFYSLCFCIKIHY